MRRIMLFVLAALTFAACTHVEDEFSFNRSDLTKTFTVGFENDATRIQLNDAGKSVWNEGDAVSVFHKSEENLKAIFQGKSGDRSGIIKIEKEATGGEFSENTVIVYPYNGEYSYNAAMSTLKTTLPATLNYLQGSYAVGENLMVALGDSDSTFTLKSVCGWLKVQLTGNGEKVKNLIVRGNDNEQISGAIAVNIEDLDVTLSDSRMAAKELVLDCNYGAVLAAEATEFYIALPPQTFKKGITVEVNCKGYEPMTISTNSELTIERNHILPMAAKAFNAKKDEEDSTSLLPEDIYPSSTTFPHRVLLVDNTGVNCGYCPRVMDGLEALRKTDVAKYYHEVTVHGGKYAPESSDMAYSAAAKVVDRFYSPTGYPNVKINFLYGDGNSSDVSSFVSVNSSIINSLVKKNGADAGIAITAIDGGSTVYTSIGVKAAVEQEYKVTAWLLESNISNPNQSGASQSYHQISNFALRDIAGAYSRSDLSGDSIGVIKKGETKECEYAFSIKDSKWVVGNMDVLVIVSAKDQYGRFEVANVALCPINKCIDYYGNEAYTDGTSTNFLNIPQPTIAAQDESSFTVKWNAVPNAAYYTVEFNGKSYETTKTEMTFTDLATGQYQVSVTAMASAGSDYQDSFPGSVSVTIISNTPDVVFEAKKLNGQYYGWKSRAYKYLAILSTNGATGFAYAKKGDSFYRFYIYSNTSSGEPAKLPTGVYEFDDYNTYVAGSFSKEYSVLTTYVDGTSTERTPTSGTITVTNNHIEALVRYNNGELHKVIYDGSLDLSYEPIN